MNFGEQIIIILPYKVFICVATHDLDFTINVYRYGPFWICTTLIFVAASIGTFVTYIAHKLKDQEWNYDINLVTWSAGLFYGYVTVVPLCLYVILKYFSVPSGFVQLLCLYGYSLFVFIPALVSYCFLKFLYFNIV